MRAGPKSTRWRLTLWVLGLGVFIVLAAMQWQQARQTRFLEPVGCASITNAYATWTAAPEQTVASATRLTFQYPFMMLGPVNSGIPATGTVIFYDLPYSPAGYALNIGVASADDRAPPLITVALNDIILRTIQVPHSRLGSYRPFHSDEVPIPGAILKPEKTNRLAIRTGKGLHWQGHLVLIPHAQWRRVLPLLVPLSGWCVLATALFFIRSPAGRRGFPLLMCGILFIIYLQSFYVRNMAPVGGFFFSDSPDFIDPICKKLFTSDMNKHLLFMPAIRFLVKPFHSLCQSQVSSLSAALAFVGALNGMLAFLWFRRWLGEFRTAGALALIYSFSLAIWTYSSLYETYPFSSLLGNLFFWVMLVAPPPNRFRHLILPSLVIGIAALAHLPLLILFVPLVIRTAFQYPRAFPWLGTVAAALLIISVFLAGQTLIRNYYEERTILPRAIEQRIQTAPDPLSREISSIQWVYGEYAQQQRPTLTQLGTVLTGQFVYALTGRPYPFEWSRGVEGLRDYVDSASGLVSLWCLLLLWLGAFMALVRFPAFRWHSVALFLGVMAPWLTFFLFFNPSEMLLYSAPMIAPILAWLGGAQRLVYKQHTAGLLLVISLILTIHNTWVLTSYY